MWEYKKIFVGNLDKHSMTTERLNEFGANDWELVESESSAEYLSDNASSGLIRVEGKEWIFKRLMRIGQ